MALREQTAVTIIRPSRGWAALDLRDLWLYRELVYFLTWRDLKVRYKQTLLGAAWAILQPFLTMVVFTIFFGNFAKVSSEGLPYPVFSYTALLPWGLFAKALNDASRSLVGNSHMLTKIYFPRLILPLASVLSGVVDFGIAFLFLLGMMAYYGIYPTWGILILPVLLLLALVTALGVGLWLSALNVLYRDVGYALPFLTQLWMFVSPIIYSINTVPEQWRLLYALNPMTGVVQGFRWALLGSQTEQLGLILAISSGMALFILISGLFYFRRMERLFADRV
ncbi:phosphate ABC transporter permease [Thermanaerothrix daxensis]|uniref:Transport permease protein n=1 Tax=Thermanaerothrix daxensis TaxID=869279 RepID=A0A0P6Y3L2_9CHLR|nr:ABC transporter permease [Thermanaerothrix daxensis]KPL83996.1 phosphate ABC transporter permease [Thermanaerothrix daxensis]